ncbi:MAG: SOS response-associated peptidase [Deltaproteobacteria bacterium]|nr:SOS response-associated peptidase [Deltaproteobacteria bacterium]
MCGRYGVKVTFSTLAKLLRAEPIEEAEWGPDLNVAPTDPAPVLVAGDAGPHLALFRWGLVPFWAKSPREGARMINARAESLADKPAFREAFATRRLLVPASGWYEWTAAPTDLPPSASAEDKKPTPHWIHPPSSGPAPSAPEQLVLFAGLWAKWRDEARQETLRTFTIVTTDASPSTRAVHDRMPVVLDAAGQAAWLDPSTPPEALRALLVPYAGPLVHHRVGKAVNNVRADGPALILPVDETTGELRAEAARVQGKLAF